MRATFWNRGTDQEGRVIRQDVREAASIIWDSVRRMARAVLGDDADAPEIFERCLPRVSRYLDAHAIPISSQNIKTLLFVSFRRELWSVRRKRPAVIDISQYSERLRDPKWPEALESRLQVESIVRQLSTRSRTALTLRRAGYEWKEVAALLQATVPEIKSSVWRELVKLRIKLSVSNSNTTEGTISYLHRQVATRSARSTFAV
jgi:DNA-directed RNA polymerase specialized sigma24 family protein